MLLGFFLFKISDEQSDEQVMNNLFNLKTHTVANSGNKKAVVKGSVPIYLKTLVSKYSEKFRRTQRPS